MRHLLLSVILFFLSNIPAQSQPFKLGNWREHLPYIHGKTVAESSQQVYCATIEGLFSYSRSDNSIQRFTKLNGLNDYGISMVAYSSYGHLLIIAYNNSNIDLLYDDGHIVNIADIERKNVPGNKIINNIYFNGRYAYLACGFAIVVLDIDRLEIKDTYYIGPNGASMNIFDITIDANNIYAATESGIYSADINNQDLSNYNNWTKILDDVNNAGDFKSIVHYNNAIYTNYAKANMDSLLKYDGTWTWESSLVPLLNGRISSMRVNGDKLVFATGNAISTFNSSLQRDRYIDGNIVSNPKFMDAMLDANGTIWAADNLKGLIKINEPSSEIISPDGPNTAQTSEMQVVNGKLWVAHGARSKGWYNQYNYYGFSSYSDNNWITNDGISGKNMQMFGQYPLFDIMTLAVDPNDENHIFLGSGGGGLLEFRNDAPYKFYRDTNSTLKQQFGNPGQVKVHGMEMDDEGNLWMANAGVNTILNVLKKDGTWKTFNLAGLVNSSSKAGDLVIDQIGIKWVMLFENIGGAQGLLAYNDNHTIDDISDDEGVVVDFGTNYVRSMAVDKDGVLWCGTEKGIYLIYPPNTTAQQILIKQDNSYQYLLETDVVTAIAVDAANRKWIGTENGGLYLISADGQEQIEHFTSDNSPLFSNQVTSLAIDGKSGEVFIGTANGVISYQGDAIEGDQGCTDLLVYPNPVKHEYTGPVAIRGVVPNGFIKITDVGGNIVYQAKSLGAQAIWDGKNLNGERVQTGVYLVFSFDADGANTCTTKLLLSH